MSVTYIIDFQVKRDKLARFHHLLGGVLDAMRCEPMFMNATLHQDPVDQGHLLLHETWRYHEDVVTTQLSRSYRKDWHAELPALLECERKIGVWTPLRSDRTD